MRIHRIEVQDLRGVEHAVLADVPEAGVLVLEGPNEAGKSTMLKALDMLLTEKASARKQYVKDSQPVGRDVAPRVSAELTIGPERFVYTKQWLRSPSTEFRAVGGARRLTGDDAHNHVSGLLAEHGDETLRRALQLLQEGPLEVTGLDGSQRLAAALDAASGGEAADEQGEAATLLERVEADAGECWTAKGQPRGELKRLQDAHAEAVAAEEAAQAAVDAIESEVQRAADLAQRVEAADERRRVAQRTRDELEKRWADTESERCAVAEAEEALRRAGREHERAVADAGAREELVAEAERATADVTAAQEAQEAASGPRAEADEALAEVVGEREEAEAAEDEARSGVRAAEAAEGLARAAAGLTSLQRTVERLDALRARQRTIAETLAGQVVDDAALERITGAQEQLHLATARRDAASPRLRVAGDTAVPVSVGGRALPADEWPWEEPVTQPTVVEVSGVQVHVLPPEGAGEDEVESARRTLAEALAAVEVRDVAEAHRRHLEVQRVRAERDDVDAQLADALEGRTVEEWRSEAADAAHQVEQAAEEPVDPAAAREALAAAREGHETARHAAESLRAREAAAREAVTTRRAAAERAEVQLEAATAAAARVADRLAAARGVADDDAVAAAVRVAAEALESAEERVTERRAALAAAGSVSPEDVESARVAAERAEERHRRARDEHQQAEGMVKQAGKEGRADALARAGAEREHLAADLARVQARADALRLLLETLRARRAEAQAAYVRPFREALEELGAVVHGDGFSVDVSPNLAITSRTVDGVPVPLADLSTGAREQLAVLSRLAVARVVDPGEGVPVVLDDALGWTDPDRLRSMGRALGRAGEDAQVIVLTCTPGRYDAVPGAHVVHTDDLRAAAAATGRVTD